MSNENSKSYTAEEVAVAVLKKAEEMIANSKLAKANTTHEVEVGEEPTTDDSECPAYLAEADIESGSSTGKHGEAKSSGMEDGIEGSGEEGFDEDGNPKKKKAIVDGIDSDDDGDIDTVSTDEDGDGVADITSEDIDDDGAMDTISEDVDGDGSTDITSSDIDEDGDTDMVSEDLDGDGETDITAVKPKKEDKKKENPFQKAEKLNNFMKMRKAKQVEKFKGCEAAAPLDKKAAKNKKIEKFLGVEGKSVAASMKQKRNATETGRPSAAPKAPSIPQPPKANGGM